MCIWPVFKSILVGLTKNLDQKEIIAKKSQDFPKTAFICILCKQFTTFLKKMVY